MRGAWLRDQANYYLTGQFPTSWWRRDPETLREVKELAEKVRYRKQKRSIPIRRTIPNYEFKPTEPKSGRCSYCYPEVLSIHYRHGRISRNRLKNPKHFERAFGDWREEWEEENIPEGYGEEGPGFWNGPNYSIHSEEYGPCSICEKVIGVG